MWAPKKIHDVLFHFSYLLNAFAYLNDLFLSNRSSSSNDIIRFIANVVREKVLDEKKLEGVRAHLGLETTLLFIGMICFFSSCPSFLSYRVFRMWIGIHQFHFLHLIGIGIRYEGVGY